MSKEIKPDIRCLSNSSGENDFTSKSKADSIPKKKKQKTKENLSKTISIKNKKFFIILIVGAIILFCVLIIGVVFILKFFKGKKKKIEMDLDTTSQDTSIIFETPVNPEIDFPQPENQLKKEFNILTKTGDLKHISVIQTSKDETKMNGETITSKIIRKTNYDIYFKSEENASEENSKYYSKMYKGIVSIRSECTTADGDDCQEKPLVDLISKPRNIRALNSEDFKDIPIPLCIFNITDNDVITTLICPESLPDNKRNEIILDLYFFRPPAVERADKKGDNITLTIKKENKLTKIHETNGGFCNIYNNLGSHCTTDMNTTLDQEGNLLSYDEEAITIVNYDDKNSYVKNKVTKLVDISKDITKTDINNYENSLDNLLSLIKPYMKEEIQFTIKEYEDLYNVVNDKKRQNSSSYETQSYEPKKTRNTFRNLNYISNGYLFVKQAKLFSNQITQVQIDLNFKINAGINSQVMGAYSSIVFDDQEIIYSSFEEVSVIQELLEKLSTLSKAGNYLAGILYEKIYRKLDEITNQVSIKINSLDELLMYYDIYAVFNSTLIEYSYKKLPYEMVEVSNQLINSLSGIYYNIKSGNIKSYVDILSNNIYIYNNELHELVVNMLNNLRNLSNTLLTKNNIFTEISNYYLNNTSSSYVNLIQNIKIILGSYFINEYEKVNTTIQEIIDLLELNSNDTLKDVLNSLNDLYTNLKEKIYTINSITEPEYKTVLSNLDDSIQYPSDIIKKIKDYICENMHLKENGYLISNEDIININNSFTYIIEEAKEVVKKLDNVEIIDKAFDKIMIKFQEGFINTVKFMEEIKSSNFTLEEDVLNTTLFNQNEKNKIENDLKKLSDNILGVIKTEKNSYITKIKNYFKKFIDDNLVDLNDIISDLNVLLSEEAMFNIQQAFEISLNSSLQKLINTTNENMNLAKQYFDLYYKLISNNSELKKILRNYSLDYNVVYDPYYGNAQISQHPDYDIIFGTMRTTAYLSKYNTFIGNFNYSQEYLLNQLHFDFTNEYREIFTKIKEELESIINNKLSEKFSNFSEFDFFDNHVRIIDKLKAKIDKYFSQEIFDKKYLKIINESINSNIEHIISTKNYIYSKHNFIQTLNSYDDHINDICIYFKRKVCYGCTNCISYTFFYDRFCFILTPYEYNYLKLTKITFDSIQNFSEYNLIFNNILNKINGTTSRYNYILKNFETNISLIKQETLNQNITNNYLEELNNWVILILSQKFENVILSSTYNYYKQNLDSKLAIMFSDIFNKWKKLFITLRNDINNDNNDFKYSMFEFSNMADIYRTIIQTDLTENYFNSIISFEKLEFNYTISHYYNYLLKLIDKYYKYIIQKISKDLNDFEDILIDKKLEIKNNFDNLNQIIYNSEKKYLKIENQLNISKTNETDFFKVKYILKENIKNVSDTLEEVTDDIGMIEMFLTDGDKYSLVMRYYLENKELGKLMEQYYEPLDKGEFLYLKLSKFKDIMLENWIFDSEDFVNILNNALYETNKEIKNELNIKLLEYSTSIENELNEFFESIEKIISDLFSSQIKDFTSSQKNNINNIITELINEFEEKMELEAERIENNINNYNLNIGNISNYIINYKENIINRINISVFEVLNKFYDNIYNKIYIDLFQKKGRDYLDKVKNVFNDFSLKEYKLLNSSYKIVDILYDLVEDIIENNIIIIKKKLINKYFDYYEKIKSSLNLESINSNIENNLNNIYQTVLLPKLKEENNCTLTECPKFDFSQETKVGIEDIITEKMNNIKNEISLIKGDNFEVNINITIDIPISGINILSQIYESLKEFLSFENQEQVSRINEFIQNVIKSNLEDFLNNVVPLYGNSFFERIIDYNINFKLVDLYENLHYGISKTLLYYHTLRVLNLDIKNLPFDLKIRLYNLNDFDYTVLNKVEKIKILSEKKLSELINSLKYEAKKAYTLFLNQDQTIKNSFSQSILEKIDFNLEAIMPDIEKKYQIALEKYLKEKFLNSFSIILDEQTEHTIKIFYKEKEELIESLDDLFSSVEDKDLNEINHKINATLESIKSYNGFLPTFQVSENSRLFFINYSENNLLPILNKFFIDSNKIMLEKIKKAIINNSLKIDNATPLPFQRRTKEIYDYLFDNYINPIITAINEYGNIEMVYTNNLDRIIEQKQENFRRIRLLDEYNTEEQIEEEETKKRIESKYVKESLEQMVNKTRNVKDFIDTLNSFTENEKIIKNYKNNLKFDYKKIKESIELNKYNDEIDKYLKEKLSNITKILTDYYDEINSTFSYLKNELKDSIDNIKYFLDNIKEITKNTLNDRYQRIYDSTEQINKIRTNYIEQYEEKDLRYTLKSENMMIRVLADIKNLSEYSEFKLKFTLEGEQFKVAKIKAEIVDKTLPKKVKIDVLSDYGYCYYKGYQFDIDFNDATFSSSIEYDTESNYINITSYKNFEQYEYKIKSVIANGDMVIEDIEVDNYDKQIKCANMKRNVDKEISIEVPAKIEKDDKIIDSISFCTFCKKCEEGYFLNDDICVKKCEIGENEKCNLCNPQFPQFCQSCNEKYFLPDIYNKECKNCEIDNCLECIGNTTYTQCIKCEDDFILSGGICLKNCEIGENNKCEECNDEPGKINQCKKCNNGYYLPEDSEYNTQCKKCSIEGCSTCSGNLIENNCTKCQNNLSPLYENGIIVSCIEETSSGPYRIDIIVNGKLVDGVIENKPDYVTKIQLSDGIQYNTSATCVAPASNYWWKNFNGNPGCQLPIYFNISEILPEGQNKLNENYQLYLTGTERFTGYSDSPYYEFMSFPAFYVICNSEEFGNKNYKNVIYCSDTFGVYKYLEKVNNNGRIMIGGIYSRGIDFYQLENFNYTTIVVNGTDTIGWTFGMNAGDFGEVKGSLTISFTINNLYLVKKPKNN